MKDILIVEKVTKRFGGLKALNNVSFKLKEGEILGIIGPNGAGKTTLFNVITGFYKPENGKIVFEGKDITGKPPHEVAKLGIARTFQIVKPFPELTVEEVVKVGAYLRTKDEDRIRKIVDDILKFLKIEHLRFRRSKELNLIQLKLTEVARSLATQPKLLLIDEGVAGLTPTEINEFIETVKRINEEMKITVCVVEHIMKFIMGVSDRVIVLHHGEKIFDGKPMNAYNDKKVLEAYLGERR